MLAPSLPSITWSLGAESVLEDILALSAATAETSAAMPCANSAALSKAAVAASAALSASIHQANTAALSAASAAASAAFPIVSAIP